MSITITQLQRASLNEFAELLSAIDAAEGQPIVHTVDELDEEFDGTHSTLNDVVEIRVNGTLVAGGYTALYPGESQHRCFLFGGVHPNERGHGYGTALIDHLIHAGHSRLDALDNNIEKVIGAYHSTTNTTTSACFERRGFDPTRWFDDLHRNLDTIPMPQQLDEYRIVAWDPSRDEEMRSVKNDAFRDHWGSQPTNTEEWRQLTTGAAARLDLSLAALDRNNDIVGVLLVHRHADDDASLGAKYGWINKVAVLRNHRGRGIARELIISAMRDMQRDGLERVALGVDSDNPTGAHRLYTALGFTPWTRYVIHQRPR